MEGESERDVWNWEEREGFNREREWKSINSHKKRMVKHDRWRRSMVDKPLYKTHLSLLLHSLYLSLCLSVSLFLSLKGSCVNFQKPKQRKKIRKKIYFLIGLSEFFVVGLSPRVGISWRIVPFPFQVWWIESNGSKFIGLLPFKVISIFVLNALVWENSGKEKKFEDCAFFLKGFCVNILKEKKKRKDFWLVCVSFLWWVLDS